MNHDSPPGVNTAVHAVKDLQDPRRIFSFRCADSRRDVPASGGPTNNKIEEQPEMETSEVLNNAADLIERDGWTQGNEGMLVARVPHCLEGAIAAASGLKSWVESHRGPLYRNHDVKVCPAGKALGEYLGSDMPAWAWNDQRHRTAIEVVALLRAVAVVEAAREEAMVSA